MAKKKPTRHSPPHRPPRRVSDVPTMVTPEGDLMVFGSALYQHTGMQEVLRLLSPADDFDLGDDLEPGADGQVQFAWYEIGPGAHPLPSPLGRRILANLTLAPETLEIETMSERRLAQCQRRLEQLLGTHIRLLQTGTKSVAEALAEEPLENEPEPLILPPEMIAEMEEKMLRQWVDDSIPALDGMTPREAVRTPEGRQRVLDLLDYIEQQQTRYPPPPGMFSPDYRKTKKMLGLE